MMRDILRSDGAIGRAGEHASHPFAGLSDGEAEERYPPLGALIDVDGLKVHATDTATGGPPVILIHGSNVNLRDWTFSLSERLGARNRVIAMDRPGYGYSQRGPERWTPSRQAEQLRAAAAKMGAERPIVVGHSWGALVALSWALDAPQTVSGVVSVSGTTMPWGLMVNVLDGLGVMRRGVTFYSERLARNAASGAIEAFVRRVFWPQAAPEGYLDYVGAPLSLRPATMRANAEDLAQTHAALASLSKRYGALKTPVEIVHGERDWLLSISRHVTGFVQRVPHAHAAVAPGVGHMAHHARPDLVEAAIARISAET